MAKNFLVEGLKGDGRVILYHGPDGEAAAAAYEKGADGVHETRLYRNPRHNRSRRFAADSATQELKEAPAEAKPKGKK